MMIFEGILLIKTSHESVGDSVLRGVFLFSKIINPLVLYIRVYGMYYCF